MKAGIADAVMEAADSVRHNKLRTVLSLLGMIIGTASVVAVMAAGAMLGREFIDQADAIGARLIVVYNNWELSDYQARSVFMSNRDIESMQAVAKDALFVRLNQENRDAVRGSVAKSVRVRGIDPGYWDLWPRNFSSGRRLTADDERNLAKVCVMTEDYALTFFPDGGAIGSAVTIGSFDYTVVGVVTKPEKEGLMGDGSDREMVFVPYASLERTIDWSWAGSPRVYELMVRAPSVARVPQTVSIIEDYLIRTYGAVEGKCRFKVEAIEGALNAVRTIFGAVTAIVAFIAGISLLVSGIGIMNVMLMAVSERTREIGIRKAIGARSVDIMLQFLVESLFLCLSGGAAGVLLGFGIARVVSMVAKWAFVMPLSAPALALAVSACVGLFFGLAPAKSAAGLDPVEALSRE
ncbi:MAG TPA: ABC transporter permease [Treponemataceae bacterium]|nr:ABC transporter permease [Treponemataceae bacterium]HQL32612.1 ABC transporter permease [Treponemataceae bacterium]